MSEVGLFIRSLDGALVLARSVRVRFIYAEIGPIFKIGPIFYPLLNEPKIFNLLYIVGYNTFYQAKSSKLRQKHKEPLEHRVIAQRSQSHMSGGGLKNGDRLHIFPLVRVMLCLPQVIITL